MSITHAQLLRLWRRTGGAAWEPPDPKHAAVTALLDGGYAERVNMRCGFEALGPVGLAWTAAGAALCQKLEQEEKVVEPDKQEVPAEEVQHEPMMQFFTYTHLPPHLQEVSRPFGLLAAELVLILPRNPERTVALRKLLEAKDCAVRALLYR